MSGGKVGKLALLAVPVLLGGFAGALLLGGEDDESLGPRGGGASSGSTAQREGFAPVAQQPEVLRPAAGTGAQGGRAGDDASGAGDPNAPARAAADPASGRAGPAGTRIPGAGSGAAGGRRGRGFLGGGTSRGSPRRQTERAGRNAAEDRPLQPGELRVIGSVQDDAGQPVAGVSLTLRRSGRVGGVGSGGQSRADGSFSLSAPPGRWTVFAEKVGYESTSSPPITASGEGEVQAGVLVLRQVGTGTLQVQVLDGEGQPYQGTLNLETTPLDEPGAFPDRRELACAQGALEPLTLTAGRYEVTARTTLERSQPAQVTVEPGRNATLELALAQVGLLVSIIDAETETPISGASVVVRQGGLTGASANTNAEGLAALEDVRAGRNEVSVRCVGFAGFDLDGVRTLGGERRFVTFDAAKLRETLVIRMLRGLWLHGVVLDPERTPIPEANVRVLYLQELTLQTDAQGRFAQSGFRPGLVKVRAEHPEWAYAYAEVEMREPDPEEGALPELELILSWPGGLGGQVLGSDGQPVPGVEVELMPATEAGPVARPTHRDPRWGVRAYAISDTEGHYQLTGLPPGNYDLIAHKPGYLATVERALTIASGTPGVRDLTLSSGGRISGRFVGPGGGEVSVSGQILFTPSGRHESQNQSLGAATEFALEGLQEGAYDLTIRPRGYGEVRLQGVETGSDQLITLVPSCRIVGHLQATGDPVNSLTYMIFREGGGGGSVVRVDAEGRFEIEDVDADAQRIELRAAGYPSYVIDAPELSPGETRDVTVVLEVGGSVSGRVVDDDGAPIRGAHVTVVGAAGGGRATTSDVNGDFELSGIAPGDIQLWAWANGYRGQRTDPFFVPSGGNSSGMVITLQRQ